MPSFANALCSHVHVTQRMRFAGGGLRSSRATSMLAERAGRGQGQEPPKTGKPYYPTKLLRPVAPSMVERVGPERGCFPAMGWHPATRVHDASGLPRCRTTPPSESRSSALVSTPSPTHLLDSRGPLCAPSQILMVTPHGRPGALPQVAPTWRRIKPSPLDSGSPRYFREP